MYTCLGIVGFQNTSVSVLIEAINYSISGTLNIVVINRGTNSILASSNVRSLLKILYMKKHLIINCY